VTMLRTREIKQVDAFTSIPFGGNPAGVMPQADGLTVEQMQKIAREMNVSETAFVSAPEHEGADYRVRFFTPKNEVPLCGHATIATFFLLGQEKRITPSASSVTVTQQTGAGILPVDIEFDRDLVKRVMMTQSQPQFRVCPLSRNAVAATLGVPSEEIAPEGMPLELAYTGLWHLIVPVLHMETIEEMSPNLVELAQLNHQMGVHTTHVFSMGTLHSESTLHGRDFAPAVGISEDPATGTANGALGAYLLKNGIVGGSQLIVDIIAEQGYEIGRPSTVLVEVTRAGAEITRVRVGGTAITVLEGEIVVD